jgi:hypothetical protein
MNRFFQHTDRHEFIHLFRRDVTSESTRSVKPSTWRSTSRLSAVIRKVFQQAIQAESKRFDNKNGDIINRIPFY